jgi:hypothetical protein
VADEVALELSYLQVSFVFLINNHITIASYISPSLEIQDKLHHTTYYHGHAIGGIFSGTVYDGLQNMKIIFNKLKPNSVQTLKMLRILRLTGSTSTIITPILPSGNFILHTFVVRFKSKV